MTIVSRRGYTPAIMKALGAGGRAIPNRGPARRSLLLAGAVWETVRFFLVLSVVGRLLADGVGPWLPPWLLFGASGSLLAAAGGVLMVAVPGRYEPLLGLLRLGKAFVVFAFVLLLASGALAAAVDRTIAEVGGLAIPLGPLMLGVIVLDMLFLAVLIGIRAEGREGELPEALAAPRHAAGESDHGYNESEVGHYH